MFWPSVTKNSSKANRLVNVQYCISHRINLMRLRMNVYMIIFFFSFFLALFFSFHICSFKCFGTRTLTVYFISLFFWFIFFITLIVISIMVIIMMITLMMIIMIKKFIYIDNNDDRNKDFSPKWKEWGKQMGSYGPSIWPGTYRGYLFKF